VILILKGRKLQPAHLVIPVVDNIGVHPGKSIVIATRVDGCSMQGSRVTQGVLHELLAVIHSVFYYCLMSLVQNGTINKK
jgi:hypothetical protein